MPFYALLRKEFQQLLPDRLSLRLLLLLPLLQLLLIGPALNKEVKNISYVVLDEDQSGFSRELAAKFAHHPHFSPQGQVEDDAALEAALRSGEASLALHIPKGFARRFAMALEEGTVDTASISLWLDGQDATTAQIAAGYAQALVQQWVRQSLARVSLAEGVETVEPVRIDDRILYNPELRSSWYMVPGMAAVLVTMVIALVSSFSLVREREGATLEQLLVTPVSLCEVLLSKLLPYWLVGIAEFSFALQVARVLYDIPLVGSLWHLLALVVLYSLTSVALGLCIGVMVSSRQQALFLIYFFMVFFILTSGFLLPIESMPEWTRLLTLGNATRHCLVGVREILLRGARLGDLVPEFSWLGGIAFALLALAWARFQREQ